MKILLTLIHILLINSVLSTPVNANNATNQKQIENLIKSSFNRGLFNGNILVMKNDNIIYKNSVGFTDASKTKRLTPNMVFNIGSISKELSAASIMMLVEEKKINLKDSISKFNLGLPSWAVKIKVIHLLNYSSGLPKYDWDKVRTNEDVYSDLKTIKELKFEPGTDYLYSNNNVFIRKLIIERISRKPYNDFIQQNILNHLKMKNTFLSPTKETSQFTTGFNNEGINYKEIYQMDGGTYTTTADLYKWIQGLYSGKIISTESLNILATPLAHKNATQSSLGFTTVKNGVISRHQASGQNVDFESIVDYNLENGLTTILLTNNKNYKLWAINRAINSILNNQPYFIPNHSIKEAIKEKCKTNITEGIAYYQELKSKSIEAYNFENPSELNSLGYEFLNQNKVEDAIKIFKLLVAEFPTSANSYDSLAEAYTKNDNQKMALINYQKSLKLNPENSHAAHEIDKIKYPSIDKTKFYKTYTKQQYLDDIDELANRLVSVNPNAFKYISKEEFWQKVNAKKKLISDQTIFAKFIWHMSEIIALINCGHTGLGYFNQQDAILPIELRFPLETRLIDGKLYIADALINHSKLKAGSQITTINGINVDDLMTEIFKHIKSQGFITSTKKQTFNIYNTAYLAYTLGFAQSYQVKIKGDSKIIKLNVLNEYQPKPLINPNNSCQQNLCLSFKEETNTAIMTIRDFAYYGSQFKIYKQFINNSFKEIANKGIKNLIIDVRFNGGGPSKAGILLLKYLANNRFSYFATEDSHEKKESIFPFESRFKGKIFVIIDGNGSSTTGHFVSLIKYLKLGTLIGEELGSNEFSTAGQNHFRSENTEISYSIGRYTYITATDSVNYNRGIMPDIPVTQSMEDYLQDTDTVMEYTLNLIKQND